MPGRFIGAQQYPVGQAVDDQRRQARPEVEETTYQPHAIDRVDVHGLHLLARLGAGTGRVLVAGQAIAEVAQQEHRIAGLQAQCLGLAVDVQPAMPLHHQVEAGPAHAFGAGVPAAAVAAHMEQAGIELQAL
ncbi:hypothetical protein D3C85_1228220 [compost metagenome]